MVTMSASSLIKLADRLQHNMRTLEHLPPSASAPSPAKPSTSTAPSPIASHGPNSAASSKDLAFPLGRPLTWEQLPRSPSKPAAPEGEQFLAGVEAPLRASAREPTSKAPLSGASSAFTAFSLPKLVEVARPHRTKSTIYSPCASSLPACRIATPSSHHPQHLASRPRPASRTFIAMPRPNLECPQQTSNHRHQDAIFAG